MLLSRTKLQHDYTHLEERRWKLRLEFTVQLEPSKTVLNHSPKSSLTLNGHPMILEVVAAPISNDLILGPTWIHYTNPLIDWKKRSPWMLKKEPARWILEQSTCDLVWSPWNFLLWTVYGKTVHPNGKERESALLCSLSWWDTRPELYEWLWK